MTLSTRKKVLIGAGGVLGVLIVALLLAPVFLDLNQYKPQIAAEVKKATGRELVISGPASLSLLPLPTVSLAGVKFLNAPGAQNPTMVEVKSVTVKPALWALLVGRIDVDEVVLVEPKIVLEINAEGKPNWEFTPSVAEARPAAPKPGSPAPVSLGRLTIDKGTLLFSDSKAGLSVTAEDANFTASVGSLDGPYTLAGSATVNGGPLKLDLNVGAKANDGFPVSLALEAGGGKLGFKGKLSELGPNAKLSGLANASAESLTTFLATLTNLAGQPAPPLPPLLAGKFSFDGGIEASQLQVAAHDFRLALAGDSGSGSIAVTLKPALAVEGKLSLPKVDLDRTLAGLSAVALPAARPPGKAAPPAAPTRGSGASVLDGLTAKLSIEAAEVVYNKQPVRNVAIELDAKGGAVAVPRLAATLPGDMVLQARSTMSGDPARPTVTGDFSLVGPKLRDTLAWLAVDVSSVPAGKLQRLSLKGRLGSSGGSVQVSDAAFELDDIKGSGGVTVTFSLPLTIVTRLDIDTVDIDSFLARQAGDGKKAPPPAPAATAGRPAPAGPTVGLKLKLAKAIYNKETIGGIDLDVALQGSTLKLNDVKVSNLGGGARLALRGSVANYESALPHADLVFNFEAPDLGRVLAVAGATAPAGLGQVTASGALNGTVEALTFRELNLGAQGQVARIDGTLTMPGAAKGPPSSIGYKGRIIAQGQTLEGSVEAKVAERPSITADLKTTLLDLDKLGGTAPAAAPAARGARPAAGGGGSSSMDLSALRAFDASLKLVAGTLVSSPIKVSNADIAVTLRNGVLTLQHLKGGLYGGTIDLSGTINASEPTLAFDLQGSANDIHVGEMLRSLSGTNQFGGSIKVTVDGRLNATAITLKGRGTTPEQIRASMAGGAQLGGHVFMGADKALTTLGAVAAGAAGGVIDNTLGNLLGATGQKAGVGNFLNAVALVLNRFVNRDNPLSGHIDITGGMLTDRNLVVSGNRATANIDTRTNLVASSTDTTINFVIAEDSSAPYMIATARGPFSSLSYNAVRGTAKDPPGMLNTLTNTVPSIIPGLGGNSSGGQRPQINLPIPNIFGR